MTARQRGMLPNMTPKYPKPKIMLIDMSTECENVLAEAGYNVGVGTFGYPYAVEPSNSFHPVTIDTCKLPNFSEQEIVIVNLGYPAVSGNEPEKPGDGVTGIWQRGHNGVIDPRPLAMTRVRKSFDRIVGYGGIGIVLVDDKYEINYVVGSKNQYCPFEQTDRFPASSWSLLTDLDAINCGTESGEEFEFVPASKSFGSLLARGSTNARYYCTLYPQYPQKEYWSPLAFNKFDGCVAGILKCDNPRKFLLVLPQMPELESVLPELIEHWCAKWCPKLFPFHEAGTWIHTERYEVPQIVQLQKEIIEIEADAANRVKKLQTKIETVTSKNRDWYTLLNGTGDELVQAVISAFQRIGFTDVIDIDQEVRDEGEGRNLREDIQIRDTSPTLVVDVKGITGCPEDSEAVQAEKHALMRLRESKGDFKPLTIINHQRNIPPHDRTSQPYRDEIVGNALHTQLGLMTTWDLFQLLRNKDALDWPNEAVKEVFYHSGRIDPIPSHYVHVGDIVRVWEKAFGVVPKEAIPDKCKLAIEIGDLFLECEARSLMVDEQPVAEAPAGSNCGIVLDSTSDDVKKGMRVFRITTEKAG